MLLEGKVTEIEMLPYQTSLTLKDTNVKGVSFVSLKGSDEHLSLPITLDKFIKIDVYIWLANNIEHVDSDSETYLSQENDNNGTTGCGKVIKVLDNSTFECEISGLDALLRVEAEKNIKVKIGDLVKFRGELHAEIQPRH